MRELSDVHRAGNDLDPDVISNALQIAEGCVELNLNSGNLPTVTGWDKAPQTLQVRNAGSAV